MFYLLTFHCQRVSLFLFFYNNQRKNTRRIEKEAVKRRRKSKQRRPETSGRQYLPVIYVSACQPTPSPAPLTPDSSRWLESKTQTTDLWFSLLLQQYVTLNQWLNIPFHFTENCVCVQLADSLLSLFLALLAIFFMSLVIASKSSCVSGKEEMCGNKQLRLLRQPHLLRLQINC